MGAPLTNSIFFTSPVDLGQAELINPSSVLHFSVERDDFPHSECRFRAQCSPLTDWSEWVDEVVSDPGHKLLLLGSSTIDAVMLSRNLNILRHGVSLKNLEHVLSCWSIDIHSFVWAWGESGLSLEDVVILSCLSLCRVNPLNPDGLSSADQHHVAELRRLGKLAQFGLWFMAQGICKDVTVYVEKTS